MIKFITIFLMGLEFVLSSEPVPNEVQTDDIAFLIRSQRSKVHLERAEATKTDIVSQCKTINKNGCKVDLIHSKYLSPGSWTVLPIFNGLAKDYSNRKWLFFCEEETQVNVAGLLQVLKRYNHDKTGFLGKGLVDQVPSIIHHYKFHEDVTKFLFPDFEAGWLLSLELVKHLAERWEEDSPDINFTIDVKHEVALFIWNNNEGERLVSVPELCADGSKLKDQYQEGQCVTQHSKTINQCGEPVSQDKVLFAVKTCHKFHESRVQIVLGTWARFAKNVMFYSDLEDADIPTVDLRIPNVERGHCSKTVEIMRRFLMEKKQGHFDWLIIVDDDTILSVSRLVKLLSCYDATSNVFLGERYGYGHGKSFGYDYVTGGGGMVFSRKAVATLIEKGLQCPSHEDPDDMILGVHAKSSGIHITHSPLFHQSQPQQYALGFLQHQTPITFHKHTNIDPYEVYNTWFEDRDSEMQSDNEAYKKPKEEL